MTCLALCWQLKLSGEPGVFSLDRLVLGVCSDPRASLEALARCQPLLLDLQRQQHEQQQRLQQLGTPAADDR